MEKLTAIVIANNEMEYAKLTMEGLRNFGNPEELNVILVDNHSKDGLREWASGQRDFTFVYMDEGEEKTGSLLCDVIEALGIDSDILVMEAHYLLTPFALERMYETLYSDESIGIVGGVINGEYQGQSIPKHIRDYSDASKYSMSSCSNTVKDIISLSSGPFLIKEDALRLAGGFEKSIGSINRIIMQVAIQAHYKGYRSVIRTEAILWNLLPEGSIVSDFSSKYLEEDLVFMEKCWGMHYFNFQYSVGLLSLLDSGPDEHINVLEVGCDCGATLLEVRNRYPNAGVFGCDINESAVKLASLFVNAKVCNIEEENLPFKERFDYIIFGDVLEHLHNPLRTIRYVESFLKPNGSIIACIPNVMHISVIEELLKGNFTYTESGLLDKTHIHLFTYNEIIRMFNEAGFTICEIFGAPGNISKKQSDLIDRLMETEPSAKRFMYESFQYVLKAKSEGVSI